MIWHGSAEILNYSTSSSASQSYETGETVKTKIISICTSRVLDWYVNDILEGFFNKISLAVLWYNCSPHAGLSVCITITSFKYCYAKRVFMEWGICCFPVTYCKTIAHNLQDLKFMCMVGFFSKVREAIKDNWWIFSFFLSQYAWKFIKTSKQTFWRTRCCWNDIFCPKNILICPSFVRKNNVRFLRLWSHSRHITVSQNNCWK